MTSTRRRVAVTLGLTIITIVGTPLFVLGSAYLALWLIDLLSQINR